MPAGNLAQESMYKALHAYRTDYHGQEILFYDGFDYPLPGVGPTAGALGWDLGGGTIARSTAYKFSGTGSLLVTANAGYGLAYKYLPLPFTKKIGVEFYFASPPLAFIFANFDYDSGRNNVAYQFGCDIYPSSTRLISQSPYSTREAIPKFNQQLDGCDFTVNVAWHYLKLIFDIDTHQYSKLTIDDTEEDISVYPFQVASPVANNMFRIKLGCYGAAAMSVLFDEVLVTIES